MAGVEEEGTVRLDKWLWAARFYKTRSAATEAVLGGKVEVNDAAAKPARAIRLGDLVTVKLPPYQWEVTVTGLAERRGTTAQAAALYTETDGSAEARARLAEQLRLAPDPQLSAGRPSKKDRRHWSKLRGRE